MIKHGFGQFLMVSGTEIKYHKKFISKNDPFGENRKVLDFEVGEKIDKMHTGYLLFSKKVFN